MKFNWVARDVGRKCFVRNIFVTQIRVSYAIGSISARATLLVRLGPRSRTVKPSFETVGQGLIIIAFVACGLEWFYSWICKNSKCYLMPCSVKCGIGPLQTICLICIFKKVDFHDLEDHLGLI